MFSLMVFTVLTITSGCFFIDREEEEEEEKEEVPPATQPPQMGMVLSLTSRPSLMITTWIPSVL